MKAPVDEIFNAAATGTGVTYEIGKQGTPGQAAGIATPTVNLQFISAGTFTLDVEYSLDGTNWAVYVDDFSDTDGSGVEITDSPRYLRINVSAISGNLQVLAQKFIEG